MNQFASRFSDQLRPRVVVAPSTRAESASRRRSRSPARAGGGSAPGRPGRRSRRPSSAPPRRPRSARGPSGTANPKPRGWCERRQRTCGCSAAIASTTAAVPSTLASSITRISCSIPASSSVSIALADRRGDRAGLVVGRHDDRELHRSKPSDAATSSSLSLTQAWMSASISLGPRAGRHAVLAKQPRAVGEVERHVARAAPSSAGSIGTSLPVSSRQISVVSRSERLTSRPPPTLPTNPSQRSGSVELLVDELDQVGDVQQVAHLVPAAAVADVGERPAEVVVQEPEREHALVDAAHLPRARRSPRSGRRPCAGRSWPRTRSPAARRRASSPRRASAVRRAGSASEIPAALAPSISWLRRELEPGLGPLERELGSAPDTGRRGWWRGRRPGRRRAARARGSCRRRRGWSRTGRRCRRSSRRAPRARPSTRPARRARPPRRAPRGRGRRRGRTRPRRPRGAAG